MKDAAVSLESKMDANKKRKIKFEDGSVSIFVYIASFISLNLKPQGAATKKSDAFSLIYLHYLQHYKDTTNVFGSTLTLVRYLKFCYQWCVACLANFSRGVTAKKV